MLKIRIRLFPWRGGLRRWNLMRLRLWLGTPQARRAAEMGSTPFRPWVGYSRMGAGPYWPNGYGVTNGSGYYAETWFHHALAGAKGFLYVFSLLSGQLWLIYQGEAAKPGRHRRALLFWGFQNFNCVISFSEQPYFDLLGCPQYSLI